LNMNWLFKLEMKNENGEHISTSYNYLVVNVIIK